MTSPPTGPSAECIGAVEPLGAARVCGMSIAVNQKRACDPLWFADDNMQAPSIARIACGLFPNCMYRGVKQLYEFDGVLPYTRYASLPQSPKRAVFITRTLTSLLCASEW